MAPQLQAVGPPRHRYVTRALARTLSSSSRCCNKYTVGSTPRPRLQRLNTHPRHCLSGKVGNRPRAPYFLPVQQRSLLDARPHASNLWSVWLGRDGRFVRFVPALSVMGPAAASTGHQLPHDVIGWFGVKGAEIGGLPGDAPRHACYTWQLRALLSAACCGS